MQSKTASIILLHVTLIKYPKQAKNILNNLCSPDRKATSITRLPIDKNPELCPQPKARKYITTR